MFGIYRCVVCRSLNPKYSFPRNEKTLEKCGKDGAEPKEGSWTSLQDYGDLDNPILTHATELTVEQTQVCSKLFNCFHGEGLETGKEMMGKNSNQYNQTCIHLLFANI